MGAALGGGHGRYEGLYGLVQDNIVHYNVVLGDGTEIGVNSTSYPDLLYALKGAGHNFAIVTSVVGKIYPRENWYQKTYTWKQDELETVFEALNTFHKSANGTTPPRMGVNYGSIGMNPSISTTNVSTTLSFTSTSRLLLIMTRQCYSGALNTLALLLTRKSSWDHSMPSRLSKWPQGKPHTPL
jgi:hypothetical protein